MTYFKIIQDNKVVDVGFSFLKWNLKYHRLYSCDVSIAQFVKGDNADKIYWDAWLRPAPKDVENVIYEESKIEIINETEYLDLKAQLDDGEEISIDIDSPEVEIPHEYQEEDVEEKPMSVSEMRAIIVEQAAKIDRLTNCIIEMSEVIYNE